MSILKLGRTEAALEKLQQADELAKDTEYDFYYQQALRKIETIKTPWFLRWLKR
ncbi:MAG: hypothetical protein F6J97_20085 [Leptolyngbya sp. SIO4C1]|nr:hypothetical protein [Leptolyngbya sp. SIO4C1]